MIDHLVEKKNAKLLEECVNTFEVIPEKALVSVLMFFLKESTNSNINSNIEGNGKKEHKNSKHIFIRFLILVGFRFNPDLEEQLSLVLKHSFEQVILREEIKVLGFEQSWRLIQHLHSVLATGNVNK